MLSAHQPTSEEGRAGRATGDAETGGMAVETRAHVRQRLLTVAQVATILRVPEHIVRALIRNGKLPAVRLGRKRLWRVDPGRLEGFIASLHEQTRASIESGHVDPAPAPRSRRPGKQRVWTVEELSHDEEAMTVREARGILSASSRQIHYLIRTGRLRARKDGQRWLVASEDVETLAPRARALNAPEPSGSFCRTASPG